MKALFFAALLLGNLSLAQAKTILISDIDDTMKVSHVLDKSEAMTNAFRTENVFGGVSQLYRAIKIEDPTTKFFYVTNAPKQIMQTSHSQFLSINKFPVGALRLRPSFFEDNFKVTEIRKILKAQKPDLVILLGDNGEKDPVVYDQIVKENPSIHFLTYIHIDYYSQGDEDRGASLQPDQIGYVTAWDLLLQLRHNGLVSDVAATDFMNRFAPLLLQEPDDLKLGTVIIPAWFDCRDFKWTAPDGDLMGFQAHALMKEKILDRCSHEAIED